MLLPYIKYINIFASIFHMPCIRSRFFDNPRRWKQNNRVQRKKKWSRNGAVLKQPVPHFVSRVRSGILLFSDEVPGGGGGKGWEAFFWWRFFLFFLVCVWNGEWG
ncbi:hypothetical protein, unlikely [Trypanosoma brucei gambiense DAL972]|uniref:Uncharacterized protein n=1 Tax=Trypanosoma brucei gambiense (strain MHOM/CI/86/DAL972) TaxID=679716 RepID=D0A2C5_TRYB9|nr:hypothetical protein, unlikely [Trypanosoma brucei gambiense DAL972]CBH15419.1 hypothetical protein, unlikely [Trypanosoma brucei gambiense DAL972]|eukprot:XP_011777683.1 hypothetical protein, unlikely [Trypanosoma brucei gambiense DAL972]